MKHRSALFAAAVVAGLMGSGTFACSKSAAPPLTAAPGPRGTFVQAGAKFNGTLQSPLSTLSSMTNDRFTVSLDEDVLANDGSVALARGSVLHGHVVKVDHRKEHQMAGDDAPKLAIAIDSLSTDHGDINISVGVIDAGGYATVGIAGPQEAHDSTFSPPVGPKAAFGGGPRDYSGNNAVAPDYEVTIPTGTKLLLMITEPVVTY